MSEATKKSELFNLLDGIRKNENQMKLFVKELEGFIPNRGEDTLDFCKMYTISILKKGCHSLDDKELMLAACGLLYGNSFHDENMEDRVVAYWKYSRSYNKIFKKITTKGSAIRTANKHMNRIMDYLTEDLIKAKNDNNGKLDFISKVPNKLELYSPRKVFNTKEVQSGNSAKNNESGKAACNDDIVNDLSCNNISLTTANKELEKSQRPQDGSQPKSESEISKNISSKKKASEPSLINIQLNKDDVRQNRNEPKDFDANGAKRHKHRKKRKVNISSKSESATVAAAGSHVSVHIVNVVGESQKSNNVASIQDTSEKIQKISLSGSEELKEGLTDSPDKDKNDKKYINLPKLCYTLENFIPPNTNSEEGSDEQKDKTGKSHKPTSVRIKIPWHLKLPIILASIVAVSLISVLSILIYQYKVTPPEIKQISAKTEVLVRPGEKEDLTLNVYPDSADWGQLSFKIGNKEIVGVTNDWWVVGLDGLGDNDSDNTAIVIWGGKAEPALVTVTVVKPGSRGK